MTPSPSFDVFPLTPQNARIIKFTALTKRESFFRLQLDAEIKTYRPGQFLMLSIPGVGEAPISISSVSDDGWTVDVVIRNCGGSLTYAFHQLKEEDYIGWRGPFGNGFDVSQFESFDIVLIAGGLGLVPLRSLIEVLLSDRSRYGHITLISGCRTPADELYGIYMAHWARLFQVKVIRLVNETRHQPWDGDVGLVTEPIATLSLEAENTVAVLCGPPVMYKFAIIALTERGLSQNRIFIDLERRMRCGIGKCGHCQINEVYCCQDGPVFQLTDIGSLPEAFT